MIKITCPKCNKYIGKVEPVHVEGIDVVVTDCIYCDYKLEDD